MLATAPYAAAPHHLNNNDVCTAGCRTAAAGTFSEKDHRGLRARHRRDQCYCCRQRFFFVVAADAQKNAASLSPASAAVEA
ncbi:hypothetical protein PG985_008096 [Apiospora marii]|uniref:Uncharacterized protein n=1 Tax=Apiospora marii TaxID=335849 RepID=A0ABR1R9J3_9PEZI